MKKETFFVFLSIAQKSPLYTYLPKNIEFTSQFVMKVSSVLLKSDR